MIMPGNRVRGAYDKKSAKRSIEIGGKMRYIFVIFFVLIAGICVSAYADGENKAKGLEMVTETAASAVDKVNALLTGSLEITMSGDPAIDKTKYTTNAIGQRVPISTTSYARKGSQTVSTPQ
jgi:hypothetical protein